MATDINRIIQNLLAFYDFKDKVVISVGAGGGQLIKYAEPAKKVIAIDCDEVAIQKLKENLKSTPFEKKFEVIKSDFMDVDVQGDVVLFEICLHEMNNPLAVLKKAQTIASDVVIFDHLPGPWSFYTAETEKIEKSWKAVHSFPIRKEFRFEGEQLFTDYSELFEKLKILGEPSLTRIQEFQDAKKITIQMPYAMGMIW